MLYWVGCGINVVSIADIFFKRVYKCLFIQKHKICYLWACTMTAVNHHALCQPIPLTETCNLFFGLFFFFSSDFSEVTGEKCSSENTPPPHRLHTTSTHSGHAGSSPSSVSLLQLLLCFTQQKQPWGSSQYLSRTGDAFFFFSLVISPSRASSPASELALTNVLSCQGSF